MVFSSNEFKLIYYYWNIIALMVIPIESISSGCECGQEVTSHRITHGQPASQQKYPWIAYIRFTWGPGHSSFCGGALIDYQHVLTAAHCLFNHDDGSPAYLEEIQVYLGYSHRPNQSFHHWSVSDYTYDIRFNRSISPILYDMAVLKLDRPIHWFERDSLRPICLPRSDHQVYHKLMVAGYGYNDTNGKPTGQIEEVEIDFIPRRRCTKLWFRMVKELIKTKDIDDIPYLDRSHLCAINKKTRGGTCFGDSGGPLMYKNPANGRWYLLGVVSGSWVYECSSPYFPDIFTSTATYRHFIKSFATSACFKHYL